MARKKTVWGQPGQTGVTRDGIPWYVPDKPPGRGERLLYWLSPADGSYMPAGARFVPARTAGEVRERCMRKYGGLVAKRLHDDEEIEGFIGFEVDEHVPEPPRTGLTAKIGPLPIRHWWMGGDWDSMAGQFLIAIGGSHAADSRGGRFRSRARLWIRTRHRIVIAGGSMDNPLWTEAEYAPGQAGLRPGWRPSPRGNDFRRVDIAFADGSWVGLNAREANVPGATEDYTPIRDLLAELAGPPVTATVLPALGPG